METINKLDKDLIECINDKSDFCKVLKRQYEGKIDDMKNKVYSPPISGKYKGVHNIDESLAFRWALNETLACNSDTIKRMAKTA